MKKLFALLMCTAMIFSAFPCTSYAESTFGVSSVEDAYREFKEKHGDFVESMNSCGVSEELLMSYLYDVYDYILEIHSSTPITEENFEKNALAAISQISSREKYYPIQDALIILYPTAIKLAVTEGKVSDEIKPFVDTVKSIVFNNKNNSNNNNSTGNVSSRPTVNEEKSVFSDVTSEHWAYNSIKKLSENFILNGYLDGTFKPDANITRGEFAKIIVSVTDTLDVSATSSFSDVSSDDWYYLYVSSAMKEGFIKGYPDGTFRPNDNITRADICTIVQRCLNSEFTLGVTAFADDEFIPSYARDAVYSLVSLGIINGMGDRTFAPKAYATRAQTAKIICTAFFK